MWPLFISLVDTAAAAASTPVVADARSSQRRSLMHYGQRRIQLGSSYDSSCDFSDCFDPHPSLAIAVKFFPVNATDDDLADAV